jgi:hypothetical protein
MERADDGRDNRIRPLASAAISGLDGPREIARTAALCAYAERHEPDIEAIERRIPRSSVRGKAMLVDQNGAVIVQLLEEGARIPKEQQIGVGGGNGRFEPSALPRTHGGTASSDRNNEGMSATAKPPEEARRVDVPS